jgi:hypothetical protein
VTALLDALTPLLACVVLPTLFVVVVVVWHPSSWFNRRDR